jgi:hypothetical protein
LDGPLTGPETLDDALQDLVDPIDVEDHEAVEGPRVLNHVQLAKVPGVHSLIHFHLLTPDVS